MTTARFQALPRT